MASIACPSVSDLGCMAKEKLEPSNKIGISACLPFPWSRFVGQRNHQEDLRPRTAERYSYVFRRTGGYKFSRLFGDVLL